MARLIGLHILLYFLIPVWGLAQTNGSISGVVIDSEGEPVQDVVIYAVGQSQKTETKADGSYYLELPAEKEILLEFTRVGFNSYTLTLTLKPLEARTVNIRLISHDELDPIEITDRYRGQMRRIPNPGVERLPTPSGNIEDFFKSTAIGVSSNNELSSNYSVRGGNFDENLIYVNGIQIYRPFLARAGQQEGLSFINSDLISDIQFSAGGFEARYGDKLSSVLDITYKEPKKFAGSLTTSLMGANIHFQGRSENNLFTHLTGIRYRNNSYVLNSLPAQGDYKPVFADAQTLITYNLTDEFKLSFLGHFSNNNFRFVPQTRESSFGTINEALKLTVFFEGQEETQFQTMTGALSGVFEPENQPLRLQFTSSVFNTYETETFDVLGEYWLDELENDLGSDEFGEVAFNRGVGSFLNHARNRLHATVWNVYHDGTYRFDKSRLHWGAKYQMEFFDDRLSEWDFMDSAGYSIPQGLPDVVELREVLKANINMQTFRTTAYVQNTWNINKWDTVTVNDSSFASPGVLTYSIGGRLHYWDFNPQLIFSPRGHISWRPRWYYTRNDTTVVRRSAELRFSTGIYAQPPFYRELRGFDGVLNPEILAQKSIHFVLGADYTFDMWGRPFKFTSEIYYKHLYDIIPYELDNVRLRYFATNNADGYATGIDFKLNGQFVDGIESWAKLSIMQTQVDLKDDFYYDYFNSDGEQIIFGFTANDSIVDSVRYEPGYVPRPTDQRVTFGMFFQDKMPNWPSYKVQVNFLFGTALPFGPPSHERYKDTLRTPPYRRVDIGFSKDLLQNKDKLREGSFWRKVDEMWIALEVFNLLNIDNTITYTWIKDVTGRSYAIPNFLTSRRINLKLVAKF